MNIDARIVKRSLRPLFHPFRMLTRWNAKNAVGRMWKNKFLHFQANQRAVLVMHRLGHFQVAHQNPAFPEHDILGAGLVPFT